MEPLPATTQAPHPAPIEPVPIVGGQVLNDRGQQDRTRDRQTLQEASESFGQSTQVGLQGMDRRSRTMNVRAMQAIYRMVPYCEGIQMRPVPCSPLGK